jgi:hypothetical protein
MPANGTNTASTTAGATAKAERRNATDSAASYVRQTAERSVDVPVGAVLTVADRVTELVEPWTKRTSAERELRSIRTQVTREFNKIERRGTSARRRATQRARTSRNRVRRDITQRRRTVERTLKQNRTQVTRGVRKARTTVERRVGTLV